MKNRELKLFLLICFCILANTPVVLCNTPPTIIVSGDSTGDYNCNGIHDQIQINKALQFVADNPAYTTVHLKGPFTYVIDDTLLIGSNTVLEGDSTAVIKLSDHAAWSSGKPLIQQMNSLGNNNIIVKGFEINGNYGGNSETPLGSGFYNIIYFTNSNDIKVYNMYMHDGTGDGLRVNQGKNIQFYNNKISKLGHDGFYAIRSENVEAWNNRITCRTNSGLRAWNTNNVKFHDNAIDASYVGSTGGPGIQIEKSAGIMDNIEIYGNTFDSTYGPGIWVYNYDDSSATQTQGKNVKIHHNIFYNTGTNSGIDWVGGIVLGGFYDTLIENNVFDGTYHAAIAVMYPQTKYLSFYTPKNDKCNTIIRNNIIVNSRKHKKDTDLIGYGVANLLPDSHSVTLEYNCLYNNTGGNYKNVNSNTDIYADPLFADQKNHNYKLKSNGGRWDGSNWVIDAISSPCIDAGYPSSDYSNEPEPNGGRINIGPDGNTQFASKSGSSIIPVLPTADFSCNVTGGYAPLSIQFTDHSRNAALRNWDFGDNSGSTEKNPVHGFLAAGNYTVILTVSNANGTDSKMFIINLINALQKPVADFNCNVTAGNAPLNVAFTDKSTGNPNNWSWNFGDGTNSAIEDPVHSYKKAGTYTVSLTVTNAGGSNKATKSGYIVVKTLQAPVAAFSASPASGKAPLKVTFTDRSTGSPTAWNWNFGDGTGSTTQNPAHKYNKAGKYTVTLTVKNTVRSSSVKKEKYITVK